MTKIQIERAIQLFRHQAKHNETYATYLAAIGCSVDDIQELARIPFLPIELFKSHEIKTGHWTEKHIFQSSGTTSSHRSRHLVRSMKNYRDQTVKLFESIYGDLDEFVILALLPSYAPDSSLVTMVSNFIDLSKDQSSGFYSDENSFDGLAQVLRKCKKQNKKTILFGVTFSLLQFAEANEIEFSDLIIIETGGMKGRGEELTRHQVHDKLIKSFSVSTVHSEYGMTELFSQAYSSGNGIFYSNDVLLVFPGDLYDPLASGDFGVNARLNIVDLNNADTCAFIATSDIGKVDEDGSFEVLGRLDFADLRGCNLLYVD